MILASALVIVVGIPLIAAVYLLDRHVDAGPSLPQRQLATAEDAVRREPNKLSGRMQLAADYLALKRYDDAIHQYAEVLRVEPGEKSALIGRGDAYLAAGDLDSASKDFMAVVKLAKDEEMANVDPQLETAYYSLASIDIRRGDPADAVALLQTALQINRTDADALSLLGTAFVASGKAADAVGPLRAAIALVPTGWCEPYNQLALAYTALGQTAGAQYASGMVDFCEKRPDQARQKLAGVTSGESLVDATIGLALIAEDEGNVSQAATLYERVLAGDPTNFAAITGLNRLGVAPAVVPSASPGPASATPSPLPSSPKPSGGTD